MGEALVAAIAREGVARKAVRVDWFVLDWNVNAMRFYQRLGAGPSQEWVRYCLEEEAMKALADVRLAFCLLPAAPYPFGTSQRCFTSGWSQAIRSSSGAAGSNVSVTKYISAQGLVSGR